MFGRVLVLGLTMLQAFLPSPAGQEAGGVEPPAAAKGAGERGALEITYVGNEGVLIARGGTKVLIDALYRDGVPGYQVHAAGLRSSLESAAAPFDGVDVVLATHFHPDHFDADAVAAHLAAAPEAHFISTNQAVEKLRGLPSWPSISSRVKAAFPPEGEKLKLEHAGVEVTVINLHHGRELPVENLGFVIGIGETKMLHVGDTEATVDEMAAFDLGAEGIDIAFIPYWHLLSSSFRTALEQKIRPRHVIPIHLPAADAPSDYFAGHAGLDGLCSFIEREVPGAVILKVPLAGRTF